MITYRVPLHYQLKKKKEKRSLKVSTNKIYAGLHWGQRKTLKDRLLDTATRVCIPVAVVQSYPVEISYRFVFRSRPLDTLNCAYMAKMLEDALRAIGVIEDDDPKYVTRTILQVDVVPKTKRAKGAATQGTQDHEADEDYVVITINEIQ